MSKLNVKKLFGGTSILLLEWCHQTELDSCSPLAYQEMLDLVNSVIFEKRSSSFINNVSYTKNGEEHFAQKF